MDFYLSGYVKQILEIERQFREFDMVASSLSLRMANEIQFQQRDAKCMTRSIIQQERNLFGTLNMLNPDVSSLSNQIIRNLEQTATVNQSSIFESLGHSHPAMVGDILRSYQRTKDAQELIAVRHIDVTTAHHIESILSSLEASARIYSNINGNLWSPALSNAHAYQHFAERQLSRMLKENDQVAKRRSIVTNTLGGIAQNCQYTFEIGLALSSGENQIISSISKPNLYGLANQSLAFLYRNGANIDAANAVKRVLPSRIAELGQGILSAVYQLNVSSQRREKGEVFKPTNKMFNVCGLITTHIAQRREDFGEIVDHLFFLLYEGSGSGNSRLSDIIDDEILTPLWRLKHLRLDFRHDVDHGKDKSGKHRNIANAYMSLIKKEIPTTSKEWSKAQHSLYLQLLNMLNEIINAQEAEDSE